MKKFLFIASLAAFAACNNDKTAGVSTGNSDSTTTTSKDSNVTYAYPVVFSKFEMGDPANAQKLLEIWKDFDNGNLTAHKDYFADSLFILPANSAPMMGARDSILGAVQNWRNTYSSVTSTVDAVMSLNNLDSNQHYVAVWGKEVHTDKKGKTDSVFLQEVWRVNNNGKFDWMVQYDSKAAPPPPAKK